MFAPEGVPFSHREWLLILGFSMAQADFMLETSARGYFKDDALFLYEGDFQALSRKNLSLLALHWDDLKRFFKITRKTAVFSGVKKGAAGKSWPPLYRLYPEGDKFRAEPAAKPRGKKQP